MKLTALACTVALANAKLTPLQTLVSDVGIGKENLVEHLRQHHNERFLELSDAALLGNVALTLVAGTPAQNNGAEVGVAGDTLEIGTDVNGPFEGGFSSTQDGVIRNQFGCTGDTTACYSEGGLDVGIAQAICARNCDIELPRTEDGVYYGLLDSCGGHVNYHFHRDLTCLYDETASNHSTKLAETTSSTGDDGGAGGGPPGGGDGGPPGGDGGPPTRRIRRQLEDDGDDESQYLYGKWEDYSTSELPKLDACNGQYGTTPDSPDTPVYHYHITDTPPFTIGCYGPNDDGSLVTIDQCRSIYDGCDDSGEIEILTVKEDGADKIVPYQPWCPCYDASGLGFEGAGLNVGTVASTRTWVVREYVDDAWTTTSTGTVAELAGFESGITIVEPAGITATDDDTPTTTTTDDEESVDGFWANLFFCF